MHRNLLRLACKAQIIYLNGSPACRAYPRKAAPPPAKRWNLPSQKACRIGWINENRNPSHRNPERPPGRPNPSRTGCPVSVPPRAHPARLSQRMFRTGCRIWKKNPFQTPQRRRPHSAVSPSLPAIRLQIRPAGCPNYRQMLMLRRKHSCTRMTLRLFRPRQPPPKTPDHFPNGYAESNLQRPSQVVHRH